MHLIRGHRKLVQHARPRKTRYRVKWSQVQILSARPSEMSSDLL